MKDREEFIMSPKIDFCFKELMTNEEVRRGFISAVLGIQPEEIVETQLMPTLLRKERRKDKLGILDVRVKVNNCEQINMEIQIAPLDYWAERSLFYLSKMYTEQIQEGEAYSVMQKCIHVGILDFLLFPENENFYSCFHFWEDERRERYTDKLEIHILELPKLRHFQYPETELLKWARFLNAERKEEFKKMAKESPYFCVAYEVLEKLSADEIKRLEYEQRQKTILDHNSAMDYSYRMGHKEGLKEGMQQGMQQGIQQGIRTLVEICQDAGITQEELIEKVVTKYQLSQQEAEGAVKASWK